MPNTVASLNALRGNPDPDAKVLWQLVKAGSDLSKAHTPDFFFDAETEQAAQAVATALDKLGFTVELYSPDADNPQYAVKATRSMHLELKDMNKLTEQFERLASQNGVSYDGWGAEVVE